MVINLIYNSDITFMHDEMKNMNENTLTVCD
jgi:hypothetical protein